MGAISFHIWTAAIIYQDVEQHAIRVVVPPETAEPKIRSGMDLQEAGSLSYLATMHHGSTLTNPAPEEFASDVRRLSEKHQSKMQILKKYIDISLFCDPVYLVILLSNATSAISYTNFIIMLPIYMASIGLSSCDAPYMISILSFFDLIGRIVASTLADYNLIDTTYYYVGGLFVSGVGLGCVAMGKTFLMIAIPSAVMGVAAGSVVGVTALIMTDYLGTEKLTSTYGISLSVNGILQLIGPPLCTKFVSSGDNFAALFIILGSILIFGAAVWVFMPCILKYKRIKQGT